MRTLTRTLFIVAILAISSGVGAIAQGLENPRLDHNELLSAPRLEAWPASSIQSVLLAPTLRNLFPSLTPTIRVPNNIRVNEPQLSFPDGLIGRSNTAIVADPTGTFMVAGWNDAQGLCGDPFGGLCNPQNPPGLSGYGYSVDGGNTWVDGGGPIVVDDILTRGDPWLTAGGSDGRTVFFSNLAVNAVTGENLGVSIHRGHFTGSSFAWEDVLTINSANPYDLYDKEAIAARGPDIYVSLTNFIEMCGIPQSGFGQIEVWRSHDGGLTWQGPAIAAQDLTFITDPDNPDCGLEGTLLQSSVPAIADDGTLYVTYEQGPTFLATETTPDAKIMIARSTDGGISFDPPVEVAAINSMRQNPPVGYSRSRFNDHPRIAVATSGPLKGRVYISFYSAVNPVTEVPIVDQSLVSSQAYISYSDDQGLSWSPPVAIADPVPDIGIKRIWPVVNVEPSGKVDVVYYEIIERQTTPDPIDIECSVSLGGGLMRTGTVSGISYTYRAQSRDGGATFLPPTLISSDGSNWCTAISDMRPNFGDYIDAVSGPNRTLAVWADSRNAYVDVYFSAIRGR